MATDEIQPIRAQFEIIRVQTMQSGAVRVVLEASESRTDLLSTLADVKRGGGVLEVAMLPVKPERADERKIYY